MPQILACIGLCCLADRVVCALEGCLNLPAVTAAVRSQGALEDWGVGNKEERCVLYVTGCSSGSSTCWLTVDWFAQTEDLGLLIVAETKTC